uniref:TLC domain-containing protein n=1 Tax=Coccolithus braarudii TaxID=221442 RepID=A0A7S0LIK5_9EUKA
MTTYSFVRIATELAFPTNIRGYTAQQYVVTLGHQAVILPCCVLGWALGLLPEAPEVIYLLTGAYLASDSVINYTPVSGCVAGSARKPVFSWAVHAHHIFTVVLCLLGPNLPAHAVSEGAMCILLGEAGSMWITVTLLQPTRVNYVIRLWSFLVSRVIGVLMAIDILRRIEGPATRVILLAMIVGLVYDNTKTFQQMWDRRQHAGGEGK